MGLTYSFTYSPYASLPISTARLSHQNNGFSNGALPACPPIPQTVHLVAIPTPIYLILALPPCFCLIFFIAVTDIIPTTLWGLVLPIHFFKANHFPFPYSGSCTHPNTFSCGHLHQGPPLIEEAANIQTPNNTLCLKIYIGFTQYEGILRKRISQIYKILYLSSILTCKNQ